jgi:hypothetical protein
MSESGMQAVQYVDASSVPAIEALGLVVTAGGDESSMYVGYPKPADAEFAVIFPVEAGQWVLVHDAANAFEILDSEQWAGRVPAAG